MSEQESCESQAKESELYSAGNGEPKRASERESNIAIVTNTDYALSTHINEHSFQPWEVEEVVLASKVRRGHRI